MRIAVFFSGSASSLRYLHENDPNFGRLYHIVGAFSNNPEASGIAFCEKAQIPIKVISFSDWCRAYKVEKEDVVRRVSYFKMVLKRIEPFRANVIMCSGFMLIITEPLLSAYRGCILNVHPGDLTIKDWRGEPKYRGKYAVRDAVSAGEKETRSTVHIITRELDDGPLVSLSRPLAVIPGRSWQEHQEEQKWKCDGPAYATALEKISSGSFLL